MKDRRRKTRSDKFPLTLHPTGQYCKKISGKIHYLGTNKGQTLERYLEQATYLHGGQHFAQKASSYRLRQSKRRLQKPDPDSEENDLPGSEESGSGDA